MDSVRRSMGSVVGSSQGDSPPRSATHRHSRQMSSMSSYGGRPPSALTSARPSTCHSVRSIRPSTAGESIGLNADVKVENRPLTQQGLMSSRPSSQGPGRQVMDKSYYMSRLRVKKQELQAEMDSMNDEIARLQRKGAANVHLEHKHEALSNEVMLLKAQLGDLNAVVEKVEAGVSCEDLREKLWLAKERNEAVKRKIDQMFRERTCKQQNCRAAEEKLQLLEAEMESRFDQETPEIKAQFTELKGETRILAAEVERMESEIQSITASGVPLEQELMSLTPAKQRAVNLVERLLSAQAELGRLKVTEEPIVHLSPEQARGAMLLKIRQDNAEIAKAEEKSNELEADIKEYEEKIAAADKSYSELKGGRAEKFLEMQQKEKKMQAFIDNFDGMRSDHEAAALCVQQRIIQVLQYISQGSSPEDPINEINTGSKSKRPTPLTENIDELLQVLEERRQELKQLENIEEKTLKEVASAKEKLSHLQAEIEKLGRVDDLRVQTEIKCKKLELQKKTADEQKEQLLPQLKDKITKVESIRSALNGNRVHANLEELKQKLFNQQQAVIRLQKEVDMKERETNYNPVLENIRFMIGQLNTELKSTPSSLTVYSKD